MTITTTTGTWTLTVDGSPMNHRGSPEALAAAVPQSPAFPCWQATTHRPGRELVDEAGTVLGMVVLHNGEFFFRVQGDPKTYSLATQGACEQEIARRTPGAAHLVDHLSCGW